MQPGSSDHDTTQGRSHSRTSPSSTGVLSYAADLFSSLFTWSGAVDTHRSVPAAHTIHAESPEAEESSPSYDGADPGGGDVDFEENHIITNSDFGDSSQMGMVLPQRLLSRFKKLVIARQGYLLANTQKLNEMHKYLDRRRFSEDAFKALVDTFSTQTEEGLRATAPASFESLKNQLLQDWDALKEQSSVLSSLEEATSSRQYLIEKAERRFMQALSRFVRTLPQGESFAAALQEMKDTVRDGDVGSIKTSEEIPELAQSYFDRQGDVNLLLEQIGDREQRYQDEKESREHRLDQGIEPQTSEADFDTAFEMDRDALLTQLEIANKDKDDLRARCDDTGIDVEDIRFKQSRFQSATSSSSSLSLMGDEQAEFFAMGPSNLSDLLPGLQNLQRGRGDMAHDGAPNSGTEAHSPERKVEVERWLMSDSDSSFVTRQQEIRAISGLCKRRRRSDSAIFGDFFHDAETRT